MSPSSARFLDGSDAPPPSDLMARLSAAPAQLSLTERLLLFALVRALSPAVSVEIGTMWGGSALILTEALRHHPAAELWCVDPMPALRVDWSTLEPIARLIREPSPQALTTVAARMSGPIEFAFIDGIHTRAAVLADTRGLLPHLARSALLVYHDAHCHPVAEAIEECLREDARLSDAGLICRFVNRDLWPSGLYGGLRMLRFHDPSRPPTALDDLPRHVPDAGFEPIAPAVLERAGAAMTGLIADGRTPIALYGAGRHLHALAEWLIPYSPHIDCVIDDESLSIGGRRLGWPVVDRAEAIRRGVRGVFPSLVSPHLIAGGLAELAAAGVTVADPGPAPTRGPIPLDPVAAFLAAVNDLRFHGGRSRFALFGAGRFARRVLPILSARMPFVTVVAIADDDPRTHGTLWGIPIIAPERLTAFAPDALVISTPAHQPTLRRRLLADSALAPLVTAPFAGEVADGPDDRRNMPPGEVGPLVTSS
jgi:predicted O-methyltransferase YrrM